MDFNYMGWIAITVIAVLVTFIVALIGFLLWSLSKQGDERRKMITSKAMSVTFVCTVALILVEFIRSLLSEVYSGTNPFMMLVGISIIFLVSLLVYKKRYGD